MHLYQHLFLSLCPVRNPQHHQLINKLRLFTQTAYIHINIPSEWLQSKDLIKLVLSQTFDSVYEMIKMCVDQLDIVQGECLIQFIQPLNYVRVAEKKKTVNQPKSI